MPGRKDKLQEIQEILHRANLGSISANSSSFLDLFCLSLYPAGLSLVGDVFLCRREKEAEPGNNQVFFA